MISKEQYDYYADRALLFLLLLFAMECIKLILHNRKVCGSFMVQYIFCCCAFMGTVATNSFRNAYADSPPLLFEGLMSVLSLAATFWNASLFASTIQLIMGNWSDLAMHYVLVVLIIVSYYCIGNLLIMHGFI